MQSSQSALVAKCGPPLYAFLTYFSKTSLNENLQRLYSLLHWHQAFGFAPHGPHLFSGLVILAVNGVLLLLALSPPLWCQMNRDPSSLSFCDSSWIVGLSFLHFCCCYRFIFFRRLFLGLTSSSICVACILHPWLQAFHSPGYLPCFWCGRYGVMSCIFWLQTVTSVTCYLFCASFTRSVRIIGLLHSPSVPTFFLSIMLYCALWWVLFLPFSHFHHFLSFSLLFHSLVGQGYPVSVRRVLSCFTGRNYLFRSRLHS